MSLLFCDGLGRRVKAESFLRSHRPSTFFSSTTGERESKQAKDKVVGQTRGDRREKGDRIRRFETGVMRRDDVTRKGAKGG